MTQHVKGRSSAEVRADIDTLKKERATAEARLGELEATYNDVLLNGSDREAEKHEAEAAKQRRAIQRADLRLPPLQEELKAAQDREEQERFAAEQEAARKAVQELLAKIETEYRDPAAKIAAFMQEWADVTEQARSASVETPNDRLRYKPSVMGEATVQDYMVWTNKYGHERTSAPHPDDPEGPWEAKLKQRVIPPQMIRGFTLKELTEAVSLPGLAIGDKPFWQPPTTKD